MKTRKNKKRIFIALAVILTITLIPTTAFAENTNDIAITPGEQGYHPTAELVDDVRAVDAAKITKAVIAPSNVRFNRTFTYDFQPIKENGRDFNDGANMPALSSQSIQIDQGDKRATSSNGSSSLYASQTSLSFLKVGTTPAADTFTHAGEYVYLVREAQATAVDWTDSAAEYTLRVYVAESNRKLRIDGVTVNKNIDDDRNVIDDNDYEYQEGSGSGIDAKVDPSVEPPAKDGLEWNSTAGWTYLSRYNPTSMLAVTMEVSGDFADRTLPFAWTISLTQPDCCLDHSPHAIGTVLDPSGTPSGTIEVNLDGTSSSILLTHGMSIVFDAETSFKGAASTLLPVGTMIGYTQEGARGYTNDSLTITSAIDESGLSHDSSTETVGVTASSPLTVRYEAITKTDDPQNITTCNALIGQGNGNRARITNIMPGITPTSAFATMIPFLVAAIVAAAAIVILAAIRNPHVDEEDE